MKKIFRWFFPDVTKTASHRGLFSICGIFILFWVAVISIAIKKEITAQNKVDDFSYNCALNKGVAMRDLEGKLRCVPMFSAAKGRHE